MLGMLSFLLTACSEESVAEREYVDFEYLNYDAIELNTYPNDGMSDNTNQDAIKLYEDKFVKWAATVIKVNSDKRVTLQEENLGTIDVKLNKAPQGSVEVGDVVTVSGNITTYVHGLFGSKPVWKMKNGIMLVTSDEDEKAVQAYQQALKDRKKDLAQQDKEKAEKVAETEAAFLAEQEAFLKTPEGKKERIIELAGKMGVSEVIDVRNDEDYWVVDVKDSSGFSANSNRCVRIDKSASFFEKVFTEFDDIGTLLIIWNADLHDLKGNVTVDRVMEIELTDTNAATINWANFSNKNLPEIADGFWELNPT